MISETNRERKCSHSVVTYDSCSAAQAGIYKNAPGKGQEVKLEHMSDTRDGWRGETNGQEQVSDGTRLQVNNSCEEAVTEAPNIQNHPSIYQGACLFFWFYDWWSNKLVNTVSINTYARTHTSILLDYS